MMIKRCMLYLGMALAMCLGSFAAQAMERVEYAVTATFSDGSSHAAQSVKHELTIAQWRQGSESCSEPVPCNLIALSNHFSMSDAAPVGVPDWDLSFAV